MTKEDMYKIWFEKEIGEWVVTKGFSSDKNYLFCGKIVDMVKYLLEDIPKDFQLIEIIVKSKRKK